MVGAAAFDLHTWTFAKLISTAFEAREARRAGTPKATHVVDHTAAHTMHVLTSL